MTHDLDLEDQVANSFGGWVIEFGTLTVDCRDEEDAKRIVRRLDYRAEVVVRTAYGVLPGKRFEDADLTRWLSE